MQVTFWGTRGSSPVSGPQYVEFGGNTPCLEIALQSSSDVVILDAGSGIRELGVHIAKNQANYSKILHLFLTHAHWDHIQGFPFFEPAYIPGFTLNIYCTKDAAEFLNGQMKPPYFPVGTDIMRSTMVFHRLLPDSIVTIGRATVSHIPLPHPQGSTAFRVQEDDRSFVLATDTEHKEGTLNAALVGFAKKSGALIYDAQYTPSEYAAGKEGWGHSTFAEGIKVAKAADVGKLILFSHDPKHSDADVKAIEAEAQKVLPNAIAARQGQRLIL